MIPRQHLRALFSDLLSAGSVRATLLKRGEFRGSSAESVRATLLKGGDEQIILDPVGDRSAGVSKLGQSCPTLLLK